MSRYFWREMLEPILGAPAEVDEDIQQLARKLGKLSE